MKAIKKPAGKLIRFTRREAEVVMMTMEMATHVYGPPSCPKCEKSYFSVVEKLDGAFRLGVLDDSNNG